MSRKQLASKLAKLETKMEAQKSTGGGDNMSLNSHDISSTRMRPDTSGKYHFGFDYSDHKRTINALIFIDVTFKML